MTDELVKHMTGFIAAGLDRIEALTAERDAAYAQGYSDAETEISKSALGQSNEFLHSQYAKYEAAWMTAEGKLADAESLIEAQAKDHASNNIRFAEAEHRAKTAEAERDAAKAKVERLGREVNVAKYGQPDFAWSFHLEAMAELQAERDRMREALQLYADPCDATEKSPCGYTGYMCCRTARAALYGESHE